MVSIDSTSELDSKEREIEAITMSEMKEDILSPTEHVQYKGRPRRSAVLRGCDSDPAILTLRRESSVILQTSSEPAILSPTEHVRNSNLSITHNYARSKSCPDSGKLVQGSHRPLSRTVSMDLSAGIMEWWSSTQSLNDSKLPNLTEDQVGHRRNSSLPIHIQRAFPETAPSRPKSPLVLHERRSTEHRNSKDETTTQPEDLTQSLGSATLKRYESYSSVPLLTNEQGTALCWLILLKILIFCTHLPSN